MQKITIIDTFGFFFRSYYALPPLKSNSGFPTGLLTGFMNFILNVIETSDSDYLLFALDSSSNFRKELDSNYKANRSEAPADLLAQLPIAIEWIEKMGFATLSQEGFEADDIIATITKLSAQKNLEIVIISHDKDLYQLISDAKNIKLFDPIKRQKIDEAQCKAKYEIDVNYFQTYQAILGDSADNIKGVKGIGAKGAVKLINEFGSLENIYANLENISAKRTRTLLEVSKESAFLSKELVTLRDDVFEEIDFERFGLPKTSPLAKIESELIKYDMNGVLNKMGKEPTPKPKEQFEAILLDDEAKLFEVLENIDDDALVAFDTETTALDTKTAQMVGFSFAYELGKGYYVPIAHNYLGVGKQIEKSSAKEALKILAQKRLIGHNLKFDLNILYQNFGFSRLEFKADTMILAWLLNPESSVSLDNLAKRFFNHTMVSFKEVVKKGENFASVDIESATTYASEDALFTLKLYNKLLELLDEELLEEAKAVEFPFINTLIAIENNGIGLDIEHFKALQKEIDAKIEESSNAIFTLADERFNLNSPKQLASILFEKLGLTPIKKTKTGYSTNETTLLMLKDEHPIIAPILSFRELFKLKSTYIEPLIKYATANEGKVYTTFLQTSTATGRLSSKEPNLQNIPVRTKIGNEIRHGFIASEGKVLVAIDYSQIELRLLAHYSQDSTLLNAFRQGEDIHLQTAIKLFGKEAQQKRNIAKSINFGILYGMGSKKLSETIDVSIKEAKEIIESYFASFPSIKSYIEQIQEGAKREGFVSTLLNRRRYFDFANANGMQLSAYLRESVNTKFQGSSADLIKMSMNAIDRLIEHEGLDAKILLQIHDELVFEIDEAIAQEVGERFKQMMQNIYTLRVPLECSLSIAKRWGELK